MKLTSLCMGGLALAAGLAGCIQQHPPAPAGSFGVIAPNDRLAQRVAKDPLAVLQQGLTRYNRDVKSYTCTLYKRERIDPKGPMGQEQKMLCKFLATPFSVYIGVVANPIGAKKILYVEGMWDDNKMLIQPAGIAGLLGCLLVDPRGPLARADTLQFIDQFGFQRTTEELIGAYRIARQEGLLTSTVLGTDTVGGREAIVYEAWIAQPKATSRFPFPHARVWLDREWLLPIAVDTWDAQGIDRGHYRYADVNFHANLVARDFLPEANGMALPKGIAATQSSGRK